MSTTFGPGLYNDLKRRVSKFLAYRKAKKLYRIINRKMSNLQARFLGPLGHA